MNPNTSTDAVYPLLERLSNLLRGELRAAGAAGDLEPVHLQALDYLARANQYSNTPIGVADYLGLTKGNVSQRLIALERQGYLDRKPDERDGRVSHLHVTAQGRRLLRAAVPPPKWRDALTLLPADVHERLGQDLATLLRALQARHGQRSFGVCHSCRYFTPAKGGGGLCGLTQDPLAPEQTMRICREHEAPAETAGAS